MTVKRQIAASVIASALMLATAFIKPHEGISLKPYLDVVGVWTVCYGHTGNVERRMYTESECEAMLRSDVGIALTAVVYRLERDDIPAHTLAAFISFTFNVGQGNFASSTALRLLNKGQYAEACAQLLRWKYAGGRDCSIRSNGCYGVWDRRQKEYQLCMGDLSVAT